MEQSSPPGRSHARNEASARGSKGNVFNAGNAKDASDKQKAAMEKTREKMSSNAKI